MKIIIDIPENVIEDAKSSPNYYPTYYFVKIWHAIANGKPYEERPQGDLISRSDIKTHISELMLVYSGEELDNAILNVIDNAQTVETSKIEHKAYNEGFKGGVEQGIKLSQTQGEYVDISKLRLMTVEECAGHTIDYAMGWKACIEWIKKGGAE